MNILIIDNYDSFTYNLVQYIREANPKNNITVLRNDAFELDELADYDTFVFSPGPGIPTEAGKLIDVIKMYARQKPMLGICLGHQAIAEAFGGQLKQLEKVYHGLATTITFDPTIYLFNGLPNTLSVGRYHSWSVYDLPAELEFIASDEEGQIMALQHKELPIYGLQFHPESVLTAQGRQIIDNFLAIC